MTIRYIFWTILGAVTLCVTAQAQDRIYRCGNEYTNNVTPAQAKGCKLVEGGNVTVVQGMRPKAAAPKTVDSPGAAVNPGARVATAEQKSRDSDARLILQSELTKAEARQAELLKEYSNGAPEKRGDEVRNHQKYLDRVAELKASLARNESDMAGIRRELERVPASSTAAR
ncbi:MAG: putative signal peptide protein [Comamonadaceae bacterium]|nr:MAG: putative signal peptide protein [Comamonadaceae bacterium]